MDVPADIAARAAAQEAPEDEDDDIFAGVGDDYNPLAGLEDESSSDEDSEVADSATRKPEKAFASEEEKPSAVSEIAPAKPKNYFATGTSTTAEEETIDRSQPPHQRSNHSCSPQTSCSPPTNLPLRRGRNRPAF
jgi:hypothetical protein